MSRRTRKLAVVAVLLALYGCAGGEKSLTPGPALGKTLPGFEMRYGIAPGSTMNTEEVWAALDMSLPIIRKRASDLMLPKTIIRREGNEIFVRMPGGNELAAVDLRAALTLRGKLEFRLVRHEGEFMANLCASLSSDSKAGVMRIETGVDVWQDGTGAHVRQCYIAANDRVAMLNAQEAQAENCRWRGDRDRTRCVVSGRNLLMRYLAGRSDVKPEPGYGLAFEGTASSDEEGQRYWRSYYLQNASALDGTSLLFVKAGQAADRPNPNLRLHFDDEGRKRLAELTRLNLGRKLAILMDGRVMSAPVIRDPIDGGALEFELGPTSEPAKLLAIALRSGPLPLPLVEISAEDYNGPR